MAIGSIRSPALQMVGPKLGRLGAGRPDVMSRVKIGPALPDRETVEAEIARIRDLDIGDLQSRWHTVFRRRSPPHLPRHLLFRILTYRLQADRLGDLDADSRRLLDRIGSGP